MAAKKKSDTPVGRWVRGQKKEQDQTFLGHPFSPPAENATSASKNQKKMTYLSRSTQKK
jgi:hypothetical protein